MVTVGGANLSVMTWSSRTGRNVTKVAAYRCTFREFQRKDRPIPESEVEIDRDGATVRERVGAAASTQAKYDGDSGYLVARAIFIDRVHDHQLELGRLLNRQMGFRGPTGGFLALGAGIHVCLRPRAR
jgi:hypothetical protein